MALVSSRGESAPLADDSTVMILESLHERLARLEDVWNVDYKIQERRPFFVLSLKPSLRPKEWSDDNTLFNSLRNAVRPVMGEIWVNPYSEIGPVAAIEIQKQLRVSNVSNGKPCVLVMCVATANNVDIVLKFRLVKKESENFTEREANNALKIALDVGVSKIFPMLYVVFKVTTGGMGKVQRTWECIGSQNLVELTMEEKRSVPVHSECLSLLNKLHKSGYVHGDPHFGNFMKEPYIGGVRDGVPTIRLIDLDEVREVPLDQARVGHYLKILDYQAFMYWNNPRFQVFQDIYFDNDGDNHAMLQRVYRKVWLENNDDDIEIALGPYPFNDQRDKSVEDIQKSLMDPALAMKNGKTYLSYLTGLTPDLVRIKFNAIFSDTAMWRKIDGRLMKAWRELDPAAMIKPMRGGYRR
jgi:hypothetical protein